MSQWLSTCFNIKMLNNETNGSKCAGNCPWPPTTKTPPNPLEMPENLADLPEPTPNGSNRTDVNPLDDAVVALGGKPSAAGGIPAGDSALYAHAARFGVEAGIRTTLADEDLEWRRDNNGRILERLLNVNVYYKAYRSQRLDQQAELVRWRALGVRNPSAPPRKPDEE